MGPDRPRQLDVSRVARALRYDVRVEPRTEQPEVAQDVADLVAEELVLEPQRRMVVAGGRHTREADVGSPRRDAETRLAPQRVLQAIHEQGKGVR